MDKMTPFERAIAAAGSQAKLASAIGKPATVVWQIASGRRPIPADWCELIERATGVECGDLRPDLDWLRDEQGRAFYRERAKAAA